MKVSLFVNHRCNLRCVYCYNGQEFDRRMPWDIARRAIDFGFESSKKGFLLLSFFGGEPLLEIDLMEQAVDYAAAEAKRREKRLFLSLSTNGTLLDNRRLDFLRRHDFNVQVSFDGVAEAQDTTRRFPNGNSSHRKVEAHVRQLVEAGFALRVISVIDPRTVHLLGDSFEYLMDLKVPHIYFAPNYLGCWEDESCDRFEAALADLGDRYVARLRAGQDVRLDPINGKIVTHVVPGSSERVACPFGVDEIAVSPTGRIYPCDRLVRQDDPNSEVCIGDLDRGIDSARRDAMVKAKNTCDPECAACELRPRCMYWCGCANYETTGSPGKVSPLLCWFERCFIAEADRVAGLLFGEENPVFMRRFYRAKDGKR
ncbi:MAG: radical SAM protein [Myxococcales bacterium]|jgi:uncharacterized protein